MKDKDNRKNGQGSFDDDGKGNIVSIDRLQGEKADRSARPELRKVGRTREQLIRENKRKFRRLSILILLVMIFTVITVSNAAVLSWRLRRAEERLSQLEAAVAVLEAQAEPSAEDADADGLKADTR